MKYIAYRLYKDPEEIEDFSIGADKYGNYRGQGEYLASGNNSNLNLSGFIDRLKNYYTDNDIVIIYIEEIKYIDIIGKDTKMKISINTPILCGRLGDLYQQLTLKDIYEGVHIEK